jgi:hypothetical protein
MSLTVKHKEMGANKIIQLNEKKSLHPKSRSISILSRKAREDQIKLNTHH